MAKPLSLLIVEETEGDALLVLGALRRGGYEPRCEVARTPGATADALDRERWDVVVGGASTAGAATLELLERRELDTPFVVVSETAGEEAAVEWLHRGADDYLHKERLGRLAEAVERAVRRRRAAQSLRRGREQLAQEQRMEAVGRLAGAIAHDFNNLLTVITGYSGIALRRLEGGDPMRKYIEEIRGAADRASGLTRQLLAFSRRQVMRPKVFDLNEVAVGLEKTLGRLAGDDVELVTVRAPGPVLVVADPGQIEQVIVNLAVNARDAMPAGGRLTVSTSDVEVGGPDEPNAGALAPGRYALLTVADEGDGIAPDVLEHIFEPFYSTKGAGKGTGLGLSTVYGIVKQSGGEVVVRSEPGRGTTFSIFLPRAGE